MGHGNLAEHGGILVVAFQNGCQDTLIEAVLSNSQGRSVSDIEDTGDGLFIQCTKRF